MTNPTTHDDVVKALEAVIEYPEDYHALVNQCREAIPLAREAVAKAEALEFFVEHMPLAMTRLVEATGKDCPEIIRKMLEEKK